MLDVGDDDSSLVHSGSNATFTGQKISSYSGTS